MLSAWEIAAGLVVVSGGDRGGGTSELGVCFLSRVDVFYHI